MQNNQNQKFNLYVHFPDYGYKFLNNNYYKNIYNNKIYLKYNLSNMQKYSLTPIKAILSLESVHPEKAKTKTVLIFPKFNKTICLSYIYLGLDFRKMCEILSLLIVKPNNNRVIKSSILTTKSFIFPGFVTHLKFPSWNKTLQISGSNKNYIFMFKKICFLD